MDTLLAALLSNAVAATGLAALVTLVGLRVRRPALLHGLWLLVLLKLVTPPIFTFSLESRKAVDLPRISIPKIAPLPIVDVPDAIATSTAAPSQPASAPFPWKQLLLAVWIGGSGAWLVLVVVRLHRFRKVLALVQPAPEWLQEETRTLAAKLELRRVPRVSVIPGAISPMIFGARVLVPDAMLTSLSRDGARSLLTHELAHLRRRDHWIRTVELLVTALYWWLPTIWWARRQLRTAEEECCDAWVGWALPDREEEYAEALLRIAGLLSRSRVALPPVASGIGHVADLKRRISMVMQAGTPHRLSPRARGAVLALALLVPLIPAWAAQDAKTDPLAEPTYRYEKAVDQLALDQELLKKAQGLSLAPEILAEARSAVEKGRARVDEAHQNLISLSHVYPELLKKNGSRASCAVCHAAAPAPRKESAENFYRLAEKFNQEGLRKVRNSLTDENSGYIVRIGDDGCSVICESKEGKTVWTSEWARPERFWASCPSRNRG